MNPKSLSDMLGDVLKVQDVRRFAVSFGTVFCLGGIALSFFIKNESNDATDPRPVVGAADRKPAPATARANEEADSVSIKNDQARRTEIVQEDDYRLAAGRWTKVGEQTAAGSSRLIDREFTAQAEYASNTNGRQIGFSRGEFSVSAAAESNQQTSAVAATPPRINDFPAISDPPAGKPLLGKMPRGYTYDQLLYRTWNGWGSYDWSAYQDH